MSLVDLIKKIGHVIAATFVHIFGSEVAKNFVRAAEALLKSEVGKIILEVVAALNNLPGEGAAKRLQAFQQIEIKLKEIGVEIKDSMINLLIELAVQKLKGTYDALPAPDTKK